MKFHPYWPLKPRWDGGTDDKIQYCERIYLSYLQLSFDYKLLFIKLFRNLWRSSNENRFLLSGEYVPD